MPKRVIIFIAMSFIAGMALPSAADRTCNVAITDHCDPFWVSFASCESRISDACEERARAECGTRYRSHSVSNVRIGDYCWIPGESPPSPDCHGLCFYQCQNNYSDDDCFSATRANCEDYCNGSCYQLGTDYGNCEDDHCFFCDDNEPNVTGGGGDSGGGGGADTDPPPPDPTPILINLDPAGFRLTSPDSGVFFDIDADGALERVSWTAPISPDGWLALDRNGNGLIDDGSELFGNFTEQPSVDEPNGYLALAVFDTAPAGGNGDGVISSADAIYSELLLWVDTIHDGVADPEELSTLESKGVIAISLDFKENRRRDRHGNLFRYRSLVDLSPNHRGQSYDVILLTD